MITAAKQRKWAILPFNVKQIRDRFLISSPWGGWLALDAGDFRKLNSLNLDRQTSLFKRLRNNRIILDENNIQKLTDEYRQLHANLFYDTGLHIAVVTDNCNFACSYCQSKKTKSRLNMDLEVATKLLGCLFAVNNPSVRLEFQGGEPLLNWRAVEFLVKHARKQNKYEKKDLIISLVSNLSLLEDKQLKFLIDHRVEFCTSLDGPAKIHDQNRVFKNGAATHAVVVEKIKKIRQEYKKKKIMQKIGALPTITQQALPFFKELIDEYVRLGFDSIHLRELNKICLAQDNWNLVGYSADEFNDFWKKSLDYILDLNKKGVDFKEDMTVRLLKKILTNKDPYFVDLESPCGAGRSQLAYAPNGDVYTCDEARMIGDDVFKLGNVLTDSYQNLMKNENLFYTLQASLLNLWDYNSAFSCWSGTCPVMNYHHQNNPVVKISQTDRHKIQNFKFEYIFEKILFDKEALKIFQNWLKEKG